MNHPFPYNFIAIEGNIGTGKTTLTKMMEKDFGSKTILEQFTDNPFLPFFYENPDRYGFQVELFFMTERHKQLQAELGQPELFPQLITSDYYFIKTLLFAKNNLKGDEYRLFQRLFHVLNNTFRRPDILVYLHRPVEDLLKNIQNRGREMEQQIKPEYLASIQQAYFEYFNTELEIPILIIDIEGAAFWNDAEKYQAILDLLKVEYPKGITRTSLQNKAEIAAE